MIIRSLILFCVLITIYFSIISSFPNKSSIPESPWYKNELKVSLLNRVKNTNPAIVAVGTSLMNTLNLNIIDSTAINLGFGGHTSIDGLKLLLYYNITPKNLLIEINYGNIDTLNWVDNFINHRFGLLPSEIRRYENRPVCFFVSKIATLLNKPIYAFSASSINLDSARVLKNVADLKDKNLEELFFKDLDDYIVEMKNSLTYFSEKGVHIYLIFLPMHPELCNSLYFERLKNKYLDFFESSNVNFVFNPKCENYFTYDGTHLSIEESNRFILELNNELHLTSK